MKFNEKDQVYEGLVMVVFTAAASIFGIHTVNKAFSKKKTRDPNQVLLRAVIWYFLSKKGKIPYSSLGRIFGFTHSAVLNQVDNAAGYIHVGDKEFLDYYYIPMNNKLEDFDEKAVLLKERINSLVRRWVKVNMTHKLEEYTNKMETKVYNLDKLIEDVETMGYRVQRSPETVFVSYKIEEDKLPEEIVILRNTYGFMVQTEIE